MKRIRNNKGQFTKDRIIPIREIKCPICGKVIIQRRSLRTQKYCSKKCQTVASQKRRIYKCKECGREIFIKPCEEGRKKYCSKKCQHKARILQRGNEIICKICQKVKNVDEFIKVKDRKSGRGYTCRVCAAALMRERYAVGLVYQKKGRNILSGEQRKINRKQSLKKYGKKPEVIEHLRIYSREKRRYNSKILHNSYIKSAISAHLGISCKDITLEMVELKRQGLIMHRNLKQFKEWRKDNESNHTDVHGEQFQDEKDHESRLSVGSDHISTAGI